MIRHSNNTSESWRKLPWKKFRKNLFRLQKRIFKARRVDDIARARSLQKLVLKSTSASLLAIRQVTQLNKGRKTAGIDGKKALTFKERFELYNKLSLVNDWKHQGLREVPIPKKNGKTRILKVPTITDRVMQNVVKNALEPCWEAQFEEHSYGFRPGRGCHDAIEQCFCLLNPSPRSSNNTWVLDADISGFFDNINHEVILESIKHFPGRKLILNWLKAGYMYKSVINPTNTGTPQGGVISPLLANIGLHGLQHYLQQVNPKIGFIRYADDFIGAT